VSDTTSRQRRRASRRSVVDYYEILQVSPRASQDVIQAAYRVLARTFHPDVNPAPAAAEQMRQLNTAYAVLGEPRRRAGYDAERARAASDGAVPHVRHAAHVPPTQSRPQARIHPATSAPPLASSAQFTTRAAVPPRLFVLLTGLALISLLVLLSMWALSAMADDSPPLMHGPADFEQAADSPDNWAQWVPQYARGRSTDSQPMLNGR
jgi:DnaJ-like protein